VLFPTSSDTLANQIGRQRRQLFQMIVGPAVFDRHVMAFHEAGFAQPLPKRTHQIREHVGRPAAEEPDHRRRPLLRAHQERPRGCRATHEMDKIAALHAITLIG
jgi:hypothetical protein